MKLSANTAIPHLKPRIMVLGIGGAGGNAVNNMIKSNIDGVDFYVANTDAQALANSLTQNTIQIGSNGLGAGAIPEVGAKAAKESLEQIEKIVKDYDMVFITAGMGGGTGTGASSVIAEAIKSKGILTVAVITKPFDFEGKKRMKIAEEGIENLEKHVDTLVTIPNQNLFRVATEMTSFVDAFKMADDVLLNGLRCITDLITTPGLVNVDFADVKTIMSGMGRAMMSSGEASGDNRAIIAADCAMVNPLLEDVSIASAKGVLINIIGGMDMTLMEVREATMRITNNINEGANIIIGSTFNEKYEGVIKVSIVAAGLDGDKIPVINKYASVDSNISPRTNPIHTKQEEYDIPMHPQIQHKSPEVEFTMEENNSYIHEANNTIQGDLYKAHINDSSSFMQQDNDMDIEDIASMGDIYTFPAMSKVPMNHEKKKGIFSFAS
jgi:cell division protein FtsZ